MKISVDGGGISKEKGRTFGNAIFIENFLNGVAEYDHKNRYFVYTFSEHQKILEKNNIHFQVLHPSKAWMKLRIPFEEMITNKDVFLAINQAIPSFTPAKVISFSHGLSFRFFPQFYRDRRKLEAQLKTLIKRSTHIVVSSLRVKSELIQLKVDPKRLVVLPFGIPYDFQSTTTEKREPFFLFAGMNHPIKNVQFVVDQFNQFITQNPHSHFQLVLCGPFEKLASRNIKIFSSLGRLKLKHLYQKATAYLSASYYESFNFPILEALSQKCPVVALESAVIPEMQEFVFAVKTSSDFQKAMKDVVNGRLKPVNQKMLHSRFSWSTYVKSLNRLYNKA